MKLLLGAIIIMAILIIVVVMYCTLIIPGRCNKYDERAGGKENCPECKTGKGAYELDPEAHECPYISCWKNGKCPFYIPLNDSSDDDK